MLEISNSMTHVILKLCNNHSTFIIFLILDLKITLKFIYVVYKNNKILYNIFEIDNIDLVSLLKHFYIRELRRQIYF